MAFDLEKPYALIYGHSWARYEQDGQLYDVNGNTLKEGPLLETGSAEHFLDATKFVLQILNGGPVARKDIFQEAASKGVDWNAVSSVFNKLGVATYSIKNVEYWRLSGKEKGVTA